jgi:hypothetical protein
LYLLFCLIADFSSESTNRRTLIRGYAVLIHIVTPCQNLLSKTQFEIRFPSSILANLHELHYLEVNIVISCILWSFKHPRVKYAVTNWVAAYLIKSLPFIKCLSIKIKPRLFSGKWFPHSCICLSLEKLVNGKHFPVKRKFGFVSKKVFFFYFGRKTLSRSCEKFRNIILFADYNKFGPQTFDCYIFCFKSFFFNFTP